jgi:hypothetical protein
MAPMLPDLCVDPHRGAYRSGYPAFVFTREFALKQDDPKRMATSQRGSLY